MSRGVSILLCILVAGAWPAFSQASSDRIDDPFDSLENGDLIFRLGNGHWSRYFRDAALHEKRFSHVGIVSVQSGATNDIGVIHALADDSTGIGSVQWVPLADFIKNHSEIAMYRMTCSERDRQRLGAEACTYLGRPFDVHFDLTSREEVYCTELVRCVYNDALGREVIGTSVINGVEIVALDNCYLVPGMRKIFDSVDPIEPASRLAD